MPVPSVLLSGTQSAERWLREGLGRLDRIDPGARRRIRGLRLAAVFAIASMAGLLAVPGPRSIGVACAATFAIWPSVYENSATRRGAIMDLLVMIASSALGTSLSAIWTSLVGTGDPILWLFPLVPGAFFVDYAKRYGALGTGIGSTAFIGQTIGFGLTLSVADLHKVWLAAGLAALATIVLRILGGPSERDADALARCRDFRRTMGSRLRRFHDALHHTEDAAFNRIGPRTAELNTAWAALDALARTEFRDSEMIAGYLRTEIKHLYALLQTVRAIDDSVRELQAGTMPGIRDRALMGLVLHTLRKVVLQGDPPDPVLIRSLRLRCERLIDRASGGWDLPIETRIALLRIGMVTRDAITPDTTSPDTTFREAEAAPSAPMRPARSGLSPNTRVGIQAALSAFVIIVLASEIGMSHVLWALAASTYVISGSVADTWSRGLRRITGTAVGVGLALGAALLFAGAAPVSWALAAFAIIIYCVWMPLRYDVAVGSYAFALVITLAQAGGSTWGAVSARGIDTVIGATIGMVFALVILPVRLRDQLSEMLARVLTDVRDHIGAELAWAGGQADAALPQAMTSAALMAEVETEKARFASLRLEGMLARDGDGGAVLLLRIDSLIETMMRIVGEAPLAADRADAALRQSVTAINAQLQLAFDAVLARLSRAARPPLPPSDVLLPVLRAYMSAHCAKTAAQPGVLLAADLAYSSRRMIGTLTDLAAELDRRDGKPEDDAPP